MYDRRRHCIALALLLTLPSAAALGDDADDAVARTPRAAVEFFLNATHAGRYEKATEVFPEGSPSGAQQARELRAVIDEYLTIDQAKLSDSPEGNLSDRLAANLEEIGRIPAGDESEPVRLTRTAAGRWVFSPATLARVPAWYASLPDQWIRARLPDFLLRAGPHDVLWWQWIALLPIALIALGVGALLAWLARLLLRPVVRRVFTHVDPHGVQRLAGPLVLLATVLVAGALAGRLFFTLPAQTFMKSLESALALLAIFWGALRCVDIGIDVLRGASFAHGRPERLALLPLFSKASKVALVAVAVVEVLQRLGYPVASLIAGLGIGGLAVALAAQKTLADLFGSVVLGIDQPFRPGDTVKFDDLTGTVESIGLRSTRIRTTNRTVVTMPNGRLADLRIESFARRDRMRVDFTLGLSRATQVGQLRKIVQDIEAFLKTVKQIHSDPPTVFLTDLKATSFDVSVGFSIDTTSDRVFSTVKQEILLHMLTIIEEAGTALAIPMHEVTLMDAPGPRSAT